MSRKAKVWMMFGAVSIVMASCTAELATMRMAPAGHSLVQSK